MITLSGFVERVDITVVKLLASDHVLCRTRPWTQWGGYVILMTSYVFVGCNSDSNSHISDRIVTSADAS